MSPRSLRKPEGGVAICLPYDADSIDEDEVREQAINTLKEHDDQNEPVFEGGRISELHVDSLYPSGILATVVDIDGLCLVVDIQLDTMEQVELLEEHLELAKKGIREEKRDEAEADD